jgi:hypothetical protein
MALALQVRDVLQEIRLPTEVGCRNTQSPTARATHARRGVKIELTLKEAYSRSYPRVQFAFKDSMIH